MGRLDDAWTKYHWAQKHAQLFIEEAAAKSGDDLFDIETEYDSETGWRRCRVSGPKEPLSDLPARAFDVLSNYRTSLDYAAFQAFLASGGLENEKAAKNVYFPIAVLPENWDEKKFKWLTPDLVTVIKAIQPCFRTDEGGRALADLSHFSSLDKHRKASVMGTLTAASVSMRMDLPAGGPGDVKFEYEQVRGPMSIEGAELLRWRITRDGVPQTMEMLYGPDVEVFARYDYRIDVSLSQGDRVCSAFSAIGDAVQDALTRIDKALEPAA